jgi:hypothetical protein
MVDKSMCMLNLVVIVLLEDSKELVVDVGEFVDIDS